MANDGFGLLGEVLGGGINREEAFLEGQLLGNKTAEAMAKARIRRDEAEQRLQLKQALRDLGIDERQAAGLETVLRGGFGNIRQGTQALGDIFEQQQRAAVVDPEVTPEVGDINRRLAGLASSPVDPVQSAGAGLFAELFGPQAGEVQVAPTGEADIEADRQLALLREAKRLHPELFRSGGTTVNIGDKTLSESLLPEGGESIVPEDIRAEEAFGAESFVKGGINALADFIGAGTPFEAEAQAKTVLAELSARTQIALRADVPGGRPPVIVQELLARYAEDPRQLFRGDELARKNLETTVAALKRSRDRAKLLLDAPTKKTPTRQGQLEDAFVSLSDTVADYEAILESIRRTEDAGEKEGFRGMEVGETRGGVKRVK